MFLYIFKNGEIEISLERYVKFVFSEGRGNLHKGDSF